MSAGGRSYDNVLLVKNEVFVFRIPPRQSNRGVRAADWNLDAPDWTGRMRIIANGKDLSIRLEDKTSGELFARCPVDQYPGVAVEPVLDSSRYFVIRVQDDSGRNAFIGMGFADRSDSFDMNVAIQDHFKWLKQEAEAAEVTAKLGTEPALDLGFKEGQTIRLQLNTKRSGEEGKQKQRPRGTGGAAGGIGLLPPPPGGSRAQPVGGGIPPPHATPLQAPKPASQPAGSGLEFDLLGGDFSSASATQNSGGGSANKSANNNPLDDWMNM